MIRRCRFCESSLDWSFVDLGYTPVANDYLTEERIRKKNYPLLPLNIRVCPTCFLVQTTEDVDPKHIFAPDYAYYSSVSESWLRHASDYADKMADRFALDATSRVIEIASNDGYLLKYFAKKGIPVLGIEPATEVADKAISIGVETEKEFFGSKVAEDLANREVRADLMPANNVLAHVPDIRDFLAGFSTLLKPEGVATFEFPHVLQLIDQVQFDTIYHEHYSYLSLIAVERFCAGAGLRVFDGETLPTHGGSLRVFVAHESAAHKPTERLVELRALETAAKLDKHETYAGFSDKVQGVKSSFQDFLADCRGRGLTIAAYGAAAKGNTFLNVCDCSKDDIVCVFDRSHAKQGKYLPGSHIEVLAPEELPRIRPDILLILPWNLKEEIMTQTKVIREWGGKWAIAVPQVEVLT